MRCVILIFLLVGYVWSQVTVTLPAGKIQGKQWQTYDAKKYLAFQGIPFAKPPVGSLRFQPPQAADKWSGVMSLPKSTNICYQIDSDSDKESEDCLYITVYTPVLNAATNKTRLPVLFSIYGGAFRNGAVGIQPNYWVQNDIVVVSANYRLGAFGFLSTGDTVLPGNAGLKDQIFALKWTYDNIHLFGGDNSKITIQGQSAGGASVGYHLVSSQSKGLFRAAIAESGSPLNTWAFLDKPLTYVLALTSELGSSSTSNWSSSQYVKYLQGISARSIDSAQAKITTIRPVVVLEPNHSGAFITSSMYTAFESGSYNQVPMILGINSEERITIVSDMSYVQKNANKLDTSPSANLPFDGTLTDPKKKSEAGKVIHDVYTSECNGKLVNKLGRYVAWESENYFTRGIIKQGLLMSHHTDVYFYQFSYDGPTGGCDLKLDGADSVGHGEENNYFSKQRSKMPSKDAVIQDRLINMWTSFIKNLNPTPQKTSVLENIIWPKVLPWSYQYLNIDSSLKVEVQPKGKYFLAWQTLFENYMKKPFVTY